MNGILGRLRAMNPLAHHITNLVTMNDCANATLAVGGSPVMTSNAEEASEMASMASALVLNMGTCDEAQYEAMALAAKAARRKGTPIVFDPVGAGATEYRRRLARRVMEELSPDIVKGNAAELSFLASLVSARLGARDRPRQRGVDSTGAAEALALRAVGEGYGCVAVATGAVDLAYASGQLWAVRGGVEEQGRVCGTGCMSASVLACLAAASGGDYLDAALSSCLIFKLAGEAARRRMASTGGGLSAFRWALMDELSLLRDEALEAAMPERCERLHA